MHILHTCHTYNWCTRHRVMTNQLHLHLLSVWYSKTFPFHHTFRLETQKAHPKETILSACSNHIMVFPWCFEYSIFDKRSTICQQLNTFLWKLLVNGCVKGTGLRCPTHPRKKHAVISVHRFKQECRGQSLRAWASFYIYMYQRCEMIWFQQQWHAKAADIHINPKLPPFLACF